MADNECPLSDREREIVQLVATGATNQQIAQQLYISTNTVKVHLRNVFGKLDVASRTEASMLALREGWVFVEGVVSEGQTEEISSGVVYPDTLPVQSLSWPQSVFLSVSAALLLVLLVWVRRPDGGFVQATGNEFTDRTAIVRSALPADVSRWQERVPLSLPRARLAVAIHDGKLYAIGGDSTDGITGEVGIYDVEADTWRSGADKPTPVANIGAVVLGGRIWVPGGYATGGAVSNSLEVYDPQTDEWSSAAPLPEPRCAYGLTILKEQIFLVGGWDGEAYVGTVFRYDPREDDWQRAEPLGTNRGFLGAATLSGRVYAVGGYDGAREYPLCEVYDPARGWDSCPDLTVGRGGLGVAVVGERLYAIGGGTSGDWEIVSNEWYDPRGDGWTSFETPILGEWRNPGVTANATSIFAVGGWSGEYLAATEEYRALIRLFLPAVR
jgi:DNA-binding CsgD family transcriptional regulator